MESHINENSLTAVATQEGSADKLAFASVVLVLFSIAAVVSGVPGRLLGEGYDFVGDYGVTQGYVAEVIAQGAYPPELVYPLPYVMLLHALSQLGEDIGAGLWACLVSLSFPLIVALFVRRYVAPGDALSNWSLALLGTFASSYFAVLSMWALNVDVIFLLVMLLAVMTGLRSPRLGGLLLAISISIKLYSAIFVILLLWYRQWKWLAYLCLFGLLIWVALPLLFFDAEQVLSFYRSWLASIDNVSKPDYSSPFVDFHPITVTQILEITLLKDTTDTELAIYARIFQIVWILAVASLLYFRLPRLSAEKAVLEGAALLLLIPLQISTKVNNPQATILMLPSILLALQLRERDIPSWRRWTVLGILAFLMVAPLFAGRNFSTPYLVPVASFALLIGFAISFLARDRQQS